MNDRYTELADLLARYAEHDGLVYGEVDCLRLAAEVADVMGAADNPFRPFCERYKTERGALAVIRAELRRRGLPKDGGLLAILQDGLPQLETWTQARRGDLAANFAVDNPFRCALGVHDAGGVFFLGETGLLRLAPYAAGLAHFRCPR